MCSHFRDLSYTHPEEDMTSEKDMTSYWKAGSGSLDVIKTESGVSFSHGRTLLHIAVINGDDARVMKLVTGSDADTNVRDNKGRTPLHYAVAAGRIDIVKILATVNANVSVKDNMGEVPFHDAARKGYADILKLLKVEFGANENAKTDNDTTPLHLAARGGHVKIVRYLVIECDSKDVNAVDKRGMTPLHFTALKNFVDVAKILIKHGADINSKTVSGMTPLLFALDGDGYGMCGGIMRLLLNHNSFDRTSLEEIVKEGDVELLKTLVNKYGLKVDDKDRYGSTLLHCAARIGQIDIAKALVLSFGTDVNVTDEHGRTPLHLALWSENHGGIARCFINDLDADINVKDRSGMSPFDIVRTRNDTLINATCILKREREDVSNSGPTSKRRRLDRDDYRHVRLSDIPFCLQNIISIDVIVLRTSVPIFTDVSEFTLCVEVLDDTSKKILVYLSGELAENFDYNIYDVISIKNVTIGITVDSDMYVLVPTDSIEIETADHWRGEVLQGWLEENIHHVSDIPASYYIRAPEDVKRDLNGSGVDQVRFITRGIVEISRTAIAYTSCFACNGWSYQRYAGGPWRCGNCDDDMDHPYPRYHLWIDVTVGTVRSRMFAGNEVGNALFDMTAKELLDIEKSNVFEFDNIINGVGRSVYTFRCSVKRTKDGVEYIVDKVLCSETRRRLW